MTEGFVLTAEVEPKPKIVTSKCHGDVDPLIAWCAFRDGDSLDAPCGYGPTEADAKAALLELERR